MRLLFIGGMGRSGSTLVERVLNELPGVCGLGEVTHVWHNGVRDNRLCGCGAPFRQCPLWRAVGQRAFGGWDNVDLDRVDALRDAVGRTRHVPALAGRWLPARRRAQLAEYVDLYVRIYAAAAAVTGAALIVDSSKDTALAFGLRRAGDVDLRVLHLVRDPRGVAYSWTRRVRDQETGELVAVPRFPALRCALAWTGHNAAYDLLAWSGHNAASDRPVRRMRYEEFLVDAPGAVGALAGFAGRPVSGADLTFLSGGQVELGVLHSVSGNRMRFDTGRLALRMDDAWRTALSAGARSLIGVLCAPLLLRYGYHRQLPSVPSVFQSDHLPDPQPQKRQKV
ncbi:sulfotransferase [Micromonospora sp. NBC_01813]|uniref:sulfotransferase n=1 Tax=Micromonospora sp. NBC_01813 TaxID=2975988 RepID=UPI002DDAD5EB|nr:sulfotransferase [Micromonospora sp. NBC_01813]